MRYNFMPMKTPFAHRLSAAVMLFALLAPQTWATCGGGGGGGTGGVRGGGGGLADETYHVPWHLVLPTDAPKDGLAVYWFPSSNEEFNKSSLRESRVLSVYSQQCVTMGVVEANGPFGQKYVPDGKLPVAVVVQASDGAEVSRLENKNGRLAVEDLE